MNHRPKNICAMPGPNGKGHCISYERGGSRKVHQIAGKDLIGETSPHGAGSFHDPQQHWILMERLDEYIQDTGS